jgi:hypothetical protein
MKGQISIELIIILAAGFMALSIILPVIIEINSNFVYLIENKNLENFSTNLKEEINLFNYLGNDSKKEFELNFQKVTFISNENKLKININKKEFEIIFPNKINFISKEYDEKINFVLIKKNDEINFEINQHN